MTKKTQRVLGDGATGDIDEPDIQPEVPVEETPEKDKKTEAKK